MTATFAFWSVAAAMTAVALLLVVPRLLAPRRMHDAAAPPAATNAAVYRGQFAELDRDFATGVLTEVDYRRARDDLLRRLLAEAGDEPSGNGPLRATPRSAIAICLSLPALAVALYVLIGDPATLRGDASIPGGNAGASTLRGDALASTLRGNAATLGSDALDTPSLAMSASDGVDVMRSQLVAHLERVPRDGRSWVLLARIDFAADRFTDAAAAYAKALAVSTKVARDAGVWCEYADALGMAQGGSLAGRPRESIERALALDAANPKALEMAGSAAFEGGDALLAATYWRQLAAQLPAGSPQQRELARAIARVDELAMLGSGTKISAK